MEITFSSKRMRALKSSASRTVTPAEARSSCSTYLHQRSAAQHETAWHGGKEACPWGAGLRVCQRGTACHTLANIAIPQQATLGSDKERAVPTCTGAQDTQNNQEQQDTCHSPHHPRPGGLLLGVAIH